MTVNIGARIILGFALILTLMAGLAAYQFGAMTTMRQTSADVLESDFAAFELMRQVRSSEQEMTIRRQEAIAFHFLAQAGIAASSSLVAQQEWEFARQRSATYLNDLIALSKQREGAARVRENAEFWREANKTGTAALLKLGEIHEAVKLQFDRLNRNELAELPSRIEAVARQRGQFAQLMDDLDAQAATVRVAADRAIDSVYSDVRQIFVIALIATSLVAMLTIWLLHRSIAPPLFELVSFVEKVGRGDLTQRVRTLGRDEMGRLARQFNEMVAGLAEVAKQTLIAATNVSGATSQLQASVSQQAASTNEQRSAIQEITTTLSEIAQSGSQIAERAKEVASSAEATADASRSGSEAVGETYRIIGAIGEQAEAVAENIVALTEKTRSVGDIIANVNDIAERSNLLALNAAIEAAAAGEQGQSFAVVAEEMKNLAGQAKEATLQVQAILRDIQQGISTSVMQTEEAVKRSEAGKLQSERMKAAIESLVASVEVSIETFEQIVAATNQQQIGIEQVTQALQDIRASSGQVADSTRGLEGATANLNALSQQLQKSVQRYLVA
jgi:methyl-accepting chemotaxis protein